MAQKFKVEFKSKDGSVKGVIKLEGDSNDADTARSFIEAATVTEIKPKAKKQRQQQAAA